VLNVPAHWRIKPSFADLSPFGAGENGRPLRIIIDDETVSTGPALDLLQAFSLRPKVELFRTDPATPARVQLGPENTTRDFLTVKYVHPTGAREVALGAASSLRSRAQVIAVEHDFDEQETWRALALMNLGRLHEIDAVVCAAPVLARNEWSDMSRTGHIVTAEQACALLGLFLRAHNDFTVRVEGNHATFLSYEKFYRGAAIAALPDFEQTLRSVWAIWHEDQRKKPFELLRGVETRLGRALMARDYVNVRIRHWRPDETWDEILYFFESLLLSLGGALDALARLLDATAGLESDPSSVGFRKGRWCRRITDQAADLVDLLADDSHLCAVVNLIAILRNFIHGQALSAELMNDDGHPHVIDYGPGVLALSGKAAEELISAASHTGGSSAWGIEQRHGEATTVMPIQFQHQAVNHVLRAIREAMATQVLTASAPDLTVPFDRHLWLGSAEHDSALRLLAGLSDTP
jgi:hypothetical protein